MSPLARRRSFPLLLLLVALTLGACTGGEEPAPGPSAVASAEGSTATPDGSASPSASPDPEVFTDEDAVLDVAIPEPFTLDPLRIQDPGASLVARQLFEGLTAWDPVEEKVVPAAAESWKLLDGGRSFRFTLRQGMTFHDGSPVTAEDFVFAFDRIAQKRSGSELAYTLERIQGFEEVNGIGSKKHLTGLKAKDDLTLIFSLDQPFVEFPTVLTHPSLVPLRAKDVKNVDRFLTEPVGNGPFQMAEAWSPGDQVVLRAFPGFYDTPALDGIRFIPFPDSATSWLKFVDGDLDVAEVPAGQIEAAATQFGENGFKPFLASYYFGFNLKAKELKEVRLRKAISLGIDRASIADRIYNGTMQAPRGIVPSGMPGFQENVCGELCDFAPEAAARLVAQLPRKARTVTLEHNEGEPHRTVARAIRQNLIEVGLSVKVKSYKFPKFLNRLQGNDHSMYRLGWIAEYPTPHAFLGSLFGSNSPDNHSGFSSAKVDKLLGQARAERSAGRRLQLYIEAEKEILKKVPIVPIGSFVSHWAAQKKVENIQFDNTGGFDAVHVSLAE